MGEICFADRSLQLYQQMETDMALCQKKELDPLKEIESCFHISNSYWATLRHDIARHEFATIEDEIKFFKTIKPLFTVEIEYYSFRYHAQLFKDSIPDYWERRMFWQRESKRLKKFQEEFKDFSAYYKGKCTDKDREWFVRDNSDINDIPGVTSYDLESRAATSHDHLVAKMLALERYMEYVNNELKEMNHVIKMKER
jgi:hypothetical protein